MITMFPEEFTIDVNKHHIENGIEGSETSCPIADAISDQYPELEVLGVGIDSTRIECEGEIKEYFMPEEASEFVVDFDAGEKVKPFVFTLIEEA